MTFAPMLARNYWTLAESVHHVFTSQSKGGPHREHLCELRNCLAFHMPVVQANDNLEDCSAAESSRVGRNCSTDHI